jgi:heme exporter protein B
MMLLAGTNLACNRAGLAIFKAVSFEVGAGTALLVTGPNGSGKTSLLRLIAGLIHPAEGRVVLEGADLDTSPGEQAHYLAHQDALKPSLTVIENLRFWADFLGGQAPEAALKAVRLESLATLPAAYLSAGQRRRLSLARLLAVPRRLWLLDEPTAALDSAGQATLIEMMRDHLAGGGIIVAATHGPLGLEGAQELRLRGARPSSEEIHGTAAPGPTRPLEGEMRRSTSLGSDKKREPAAVPQSLSAIVARDMKIAVRIGGGALMGVLFFLAVVTLIPFALGPDLALLRRVGPAVLWLGALLASLLALDRLLAADQEDGSLDLILNGPAPLELVVGAKAVAHWLTTGLPLVLASPLFGVMLNLPPAALGAVMLTLLVGTPALTFIGLIGAALAVALRRGGILLPILVLPLAIPVLIFGVAAANAALGGLVSFGTPFTILCALSLISLVVGPFAAAATLRHIE